MAAQDLTAPAITEDFIARCLQYMKAEEIADTPDELALVTDMMSSAMEYLDAAGVKRLNKTAARYDLLVFSMTLHEYDHRDDTQAASAYPLAVRLKINQLKMDSLIYA